MSYYGKVIPRLSSYLRFKLRRVLEKKGVSQNDAQVNKTHKRKLGVDAPSFIQVLLTVDPAEKA